MPANWDARFLGLAAVIAQWSKDPSTKVGAIIVRPDSHAIISTGFNGFPPGHPDAPEQYADRRYKYAHVIHAEENALRFLNYRANGCSLYTSFPVCPNCVRAAVQAGIVRIVQSIVSYQGKSEAWIKEWTERFEESRTVSKQLGIELVTYDGL